MAVVSIVGQVERCPEGDVLKDGKPVELCFSLNLAAGFQFENGDPQNDSDGLLALVRTYLRPWLWGIPKLRVAGIKGTQATEITEVRLAKDPGLASGAGLAIDPPLSWREVLETRLVTLARPGAVKRSSFLWPKGDLTKPESMEHTFDGDAGGEGEFPAEARSWAAELMNDVSTEPAPLPYAANVLRVFWVPAAADFDSLTALPVLAVGKADPKPERAPDWRPVEGQPIGLTKKDHSLHFVNLKDGELVWAYTAAAAALKEPAVNGYVNAAPRDASGSTWVDLKADAIYGADWLAELEGRAAEFFDLPGLLLKYLSTRTDEAAFAKALDNLTPLIRAALRDTVQTGAACGRRLIPGAEEPKPGAAPTLAMEWSLAGILLQELAAPIRRQIAEITEQKLEAKETLNPLRDRLQKFQAVAPAVLKAVQEWELNSDAIRRWWFGEKAAAGKERVPSVLDRMANQPLLTKDILQLEPAEQPAAWRANLAVLHSWHAALADERLARDLVFEQWSAALAAKPDLAGWWAEYRTPLREQVLPGVAVRKWLLLMHLGVRWEAINQFGGREGLRTTVKLQEALITNLAAALKTYADDRANPGPAPTFNDLPPPDGTVAGAAVAQFTAWLKDTYLPQAVPKTVMAGSQGVRDGTGTVEQPDALVVPVAGVATAGAEADSSRYGLLLRADGPNGPARHLALADAAVPDAGLPFAKALLRPIKVSYRNGVRRGLISYNNEPLSAASPAAGLADRHQLTDPAQLNGQEWLHFRNPYGPDDAGGKRPRLPGLRFGQEYKVAAFRVGMGGVLPRQLGVPDNPTRLAEPLGPTTVPSEAWRAVEYRRRVGVGPVRLQSGREPDPKPVGELGDRLPLPPIPPTVLPLARSLDVLAAAKVAGATTPAEAAEALAKAANELAQSLILLAPQLIPASAQDPDFKNGEPADAWSRSAVRDFEFAVRSPAIDLRVWDRSFEFVADGQTPTGFQRRRKQRRKVWADTYVKTDDPNAPAGTDVTLDDPVVSGFLLRLTALAADGVPVSGAKSIEEVVGFAKQSDDDGLKSEQRARVKVRIQSTLGKDPKIIRPAAAAHWTVEVPRGWVCKLELFAMVPKAAWYQFPKRWEEAPKYALYQGQFWLASPRRLVVEVATHKLPTPADLLQALRARAVAGGPLGPVREMWTEETVVAGPGGAGEALRRDWRTEVALDPGRCEPGARPLFHWVHRVSVLVQRWRWNGRPLRDDSGPVGPALPFTPPAFFAAAAAGQEDRLVEWDGLLFGDRDAGDYRRHDAAADFADRLADNPRAGRPIRLFHQDVTGDVGALYFRYAVLARSRYEGLLVTPPRDSRKGKPEGPQPDAWRRLVVPCRYDKEVPQPRVKLVLPLTDVRAPDGPDAEGEATPGLLVVLNEPWFLYGGLAEELTVEAAAAEEPVRPPPPGAPDRLAELGPDVVVARGRAAVVVPPGDYAPGAYTFEPRPAYGPVGHTFDTDTLAPELVHTSFVVPAPELTPVDGGGPAIRDLSWYFIKLRFRRRLEPTGHFAPPRDPESLPTQSIWAQFLPPSSVYAVEGGGAGVAVSQLRLQLKSGAWHLARPDALDTPVPLAATPTDDPIHARFQLWALVTESMYDAYGRLTQERFVTFCPLRGGKLGLKPEDVAAMTGAKRPRVRVVELQVLPDPAPDAKIEHAPLPGPGTTAPFTLPDYFFPPDPDGLTEARARWVRVSAPIDPRPAPSESD